MEREAQNLETIKHQLMSLNRPKKPKMLVVDDEPDNLDLLYRTFRRNFNVFKAESGVRALEVLETEGEVAVIISDQRMPEMKGTEFLSKTVGSFPNTVRIILTGFTDIEDLVEAINSGQVYKYITKPWDPNELKTVVQKAADAYELLNQRTAELLHAQDQTRLLGRIMQVSQESDSHEASLQSMATVIGEHFEADVCILEAIADNTLTATVGTYTSEGTADNWLADDPLVQEALSSKSLQAAVNIPRDPAVAEVEHYKTSDIKAHIAVPVSFRSQNLALLSLQWKQPCKRSPDDIDSLNIVAVAIALVLLSFNPI
ncbi:MAG: response regulator [Cyanobacteria bacterium J06592_8]